MITSLSHTHTHLRLTRLHQRDEDKVANERAKNALESHIFETKDAMYSEIVIGVSTEDQREVVLNVLNEAADWIEDEGYIAETQVRVLLFQGDEIRLYDL